MKSWLKGGIVGFIFGILMVILDVPFLGDFLFRLCNNVTGLEGMATIGCGWIVAFFVVIVVVLLGILIGLFIGKSRGGKK